MDYFHDIPRGPNAPRALGFASVTIDSLLFRFVEPTDSGDGVLSKNEVRRQSPNLQDFFFDHPITSAPTTLAPDFGLEEDRLYQYSVRSYSLVEGVGELPGNWSSKATLRMPRLPTAPSPPNVLLRGTMASLSWSTFIALYHLL